MLLLIWRGIKTRASGRKWLRLTCMILGLPVLERCRIWRHLRTKCILHADRGCLETLIRLQHRGCLETLIRLQHRRRLENLIRLHRRRYLGKLGRLKHRSRLGWNSRLHRRRGLE